MTEAGTPSGVKNTAAIGPTLLLPAQHSMACGAQRRDTTWPLTGEKGAGVAFYERAPIAAPNGERPRPPLEVLRTPNGPALQSAKRTQWTCVCKRGKLDQEILQFVFVFLQSIKDLMIVLFCKSLHPAYVHGEMD